MLAHTTLHSSSYNVHVEFSLPVCRFVTIYQTIKGFNLHKFLNILLKKFLKYHRKFQWVYSANTPAFGACEACCMQCTAEVHKLPHGALWKELTRCDCALARWEAFGEIAVLSAIFVPSSMDIHNLWSMFNTLFEATKIRVIQLVKQGDRLYTRPFSIGWLNQEWWGGRTCGPHWRWEMQINHFNKEPTITIYLQERTLIMLYFNILVTNTNNQINFRILVIKLLFTGM